MDDLRALGRLVDALRPWRQELVLVGGWAHRLYRYHPSAATPAHAPLVTRDADLAFSERPTLARGIGKALHDAGFEEELSGEHVPPVAEYHLGGDDSGFYAEFLTPLIGSEVGRGGRSRATVSAGGITAQRLRYLDILLVAPWTVALEAGDEFGLEERAEVRLPNPATFIAQKLLIHPSRRPEKQPQDILYIHDTLELFGAELAELRTLWHRDLAPKFDRNLLSRIGGARATLFGSVSDTIRNASRIPLDRALDPERVRMLCALGLAELFTP